MNLISLLCVCVQCSLSSVTSFYINVSLTFILTFTRSPYLTKLFKLHRLYRIKLKVKVSWNFPGISRFVTWWCMCGFCKMCVCVCVYVLVLLCVGVFVICVLVFIVFCIVCTVFLPRFVYVYYLFFSVLMWGLLSPSENSIAVSK